MHSGVIRRPSGVSEPRPKCTAWREATTTTPSSDGTSSTSPARVISAPR
ncbi:hypothetical protein ACFV4N_11910 [Actinosynnema sp. NPDC059797]